MGIGRPGRDAEALQGRILFLPPRPTLRVPRRAPARKGPGWGGWSGGCRGRAGSPLPLPCAWWGCSPRARSCILWCVFPDAQVSAGAPQSQPVVGGVCLWKLIRCHLSKRGPRVGQNPDSLPAWTSSFVNVRTGIVASSPAVSIARNCWCTGTAWMRGLLRLNYFPQQQCLC